MTASEAIGRLTVGDRGELLSMGELFPAARPRNITAGILQRFFQGIPGGSEVRKASMCIIGDQGCGKSVLIRSLQALAVAKYGRDRVHTVYTDDIRVAMDLLDDCPVQLVIIDDAMSWASSRQISEQTEIIKVYNRSRHVFEEHLNGKPGVILYIWAWQRFRELDPSFRQSDVMIFKTGISEPSEAALIEKFIGGRYSTELNRIWDTMKMGNNEVKAYAVARITSLDVARGTGLICIPQASDPSFPRMITHEEHFADTASEEDILSEVADKPEWHWRVEIWRLHREQPELTQQQIAAAVSQQRGTVVRQGYVSESLRKVREMIESK